MEQEFPGQDEERRSYFLSDTEPLGKANEH
jgi:hypothetical protein